MTEFPVMPDWLAALEDELRAAALRPDLAPRAPRRRRARRVGLAAALVAGLAATLVLTTGPDGHRTGPALARPLILKEATVAIPTQFRTLGAGALYAQRINAVGEPAARVDLPALMRSGRRVRVQSARQVPAFGGTAYLLGAPGVWCLTAPDPATLNPDIEVGVTCAPARDFARIGMALTVGSHYVAAIPQGVPNPVLQRADGTSKTLEPDEHGLVVVDSLGKAESVTRSDARGHTRVDHSP